MPEFKNFANYKSVEDWVDLLREAVAGHVDDHNKAVLREFWMEFAKLYGLPIVREAFALLNSAWANEKTNAELIMEQRALLVKTQARLDLAQDRIHDLAAYRSLLTARELDEVLSEEEERIDQIEGDPETARRRKERLHDFFETLLDRRSTDDR
jgi:hypothetical protein